MSTTSFKFSGAIYKNFFERKLRFFTIRTNSRSPKKGGSQGLKNNSQLGYFMFILMGVVLKWKEKCQGGIGVHFSNSECEDISDLGMTILLIRKWS